MIYRNRKTKRKETPKPDPSKIQTGSKIIYFSPISINMAITIPYIKPLIQSFFAQLSILIKKRLYKNANIQPAINCKKKAPKIESSAIDDKNIGEM